MKYVIMTLDDAKTMANGVDARALGAAGIAERFRLEAGADIEEIVTQLKKMSMCAACCIEGQEQHCKSLEARQIGRRLARLLERARGERAPGEAASKR